MESTSPPLFLAIFLVIIALVRLVLVSQLTFAVVRRSRRDLPWLAVYYFASFMFDTFFTLAALARGGRLVSGQTGLAPLLNIFQCSFGLLGDVAMVLFIHQTFYRDRKSPLRFLLGSALVIFGIGIGLGVGMSANRISGIPIFNPLIWGWLAFVAYQTYQRLAADRYVEDWIKARYRLMITYGLLQLVAVLLLLTEFLMLGPVALSIVTISDITISVVAIILQYLVWVMPEPFRKWLNRNQQIHAEEQVHDQALAIFEILGTSMAEGTGLSKILALFVIRKAIGEKIQTDEPRQIEACAITMGYEAWSALLNDPYLNLILKNTGKNVNPEEVIERAKHTLIEKQSLFTMQAK
jgi:hypothetical protein